VALRAFPVIYARDVEAVAAFYDRDLVVLAGAFAA
jgi:hypothetical protein